MWKIDHAERGQAGKNVCRMAFLDKDEDGKDRKTTYQLQTAIRIPPPGPERGPAIAALKKACKDLRKAADPVDPADAADTLDIEDALNAGGE